MQPFYYSGRKEFCHLMTAVFSWSAVANTKLGTALFFATSAGDEAALARAKIMPLTAQQADLKEDPIMHPEEPFIPTETSKMNQGGEEMRDHDFPVPQANQTGGGGKIVALPSSSSEPDHAEIRSGGEHKAVPGDRQSHTTETAIMDQDMSTPDFGQQH